MEYDIGNINDEDFHSSRALLKQEVSAIITALPLTPKTRDLIITNVKDKKEKDSPMEKEQEVKHDITPDKEQKIKFYAILGMLFAVIGIFMFILDAIDGFIGPIFNLGISFAVIGIIIALIASSKAKKMSVKQQQDTDVKSTLDKF
jgi:hypothetical protein